MRADRGYGSGAARRRWRRLGLAIALALGSVGCNGNPATDQDCAGILDRIVELEVRERGFRDPVLLERKQVDLRRLLGPELRQCQGKRLKPGALACVQQAASTEQISHACLR